MADSDGFRLVKYRHPRKRQPCTVRYKEDVGLNSVVSPCSAETDVGVESVNALRALVYKCCDDLRHSDFLPKLLSVVRCALGTQPAATANAGSGETGKQVCAGASEDGASSADYHSSNECDCVRLKRIVAYGVGKFSACIIARYQLALLLLLSESLAGCCCGKQDGKNSPEIARTSAAFIAVEAYDPVFDELERLVVASVGIDVVGINEEGKRAVAERTLFYMPHCPKALYNNLLWANWDEARLADVVILGNSFSAVSLSLPNRRLLANFMYVARAEAIVCEYQVENSFKFSDVFNDLSIHVFPRQRLLPELLGSREAEPTYDDDDELVVAA